MQIRMSPHLGECELRLAREQMKPRGSGLELERGSLERLVRNIEKGEARIHAQENLTAQIHASGGASAEADCLLEIFQQILETQKFDRHEVQKRLARLEGEQEHSDRLQSAWHTDQDEAEHAVAVERMASLSRRERQVLEGLIDGKPNKIIAFDLNISPRTVEIYRANVMHKFEVTSLSRLLQLAIPALGTNGHTLALPGRSAA
jgi:DNA-binding NarL/FixJ family response regulator